MSRVAPLTVGVLASGSGTLLQAILDGQDEWYRVAVVVSDREQIEALDRAAAASVPTVVVDFKAFATREEFSEAAARALLEHGVELAASAGFMRVLTAEFFDTLKVPALNSHPALLPAFPGAHGVRDALEHGVKVTGTTIHFATIDLDAGPIIAQEPVPITDGDTEQTLHERIKQAERWMYPAVLRWYAQGRIAIDGRRVHLIG